MSNHIFGSALRRTVRRAACAATLVALAAGAVRAAGLSADDPLVRPARPTARAEAAALMAVTRAGERIVAVGERGIIITSDDHGRHWTQSLVPVSVLLTGVRFATPEKGWAVGHSGVILRTEDGGATWSKQLDGFAAAQLVLAKARAMPADNPTARRQLAEAQRLVNDGADKPFFDLYAESGEVALVVGAYGLMFRTDDGGKSWKAWQDAIVNSNGAHLYVIARSGHALYLAGEQGSFFVSTDQGRSFQAAKTPYAGSYFGMAVTSQPGVVLFGLRGHSYCSTDEGKTWRDSLPGVRATLNGAATRSDGAIVVVSQAGNVLSSIDGGRSFVPLRVPDPSPFAGVTEAGDGSLILVGARGVTRLPASTFTAH